MFFVLRSISYQSGSLAKGTALHDCIDIDLVVFINGLKDIDDLMDERQTLKKRLIAEAEAFSKFQKLGLQTMRQTKFAAKFSLKGIELDVLPAFDALQTCKYLFPCSLELSLSFVFFFKKMLFPLVCVIPYFRKCVDVKNCHGLFRKVFSYFQTFYREKNL